MSIESKNIKLVRDINHTGMLGIVGAVVEVSC